MALALTDDHAQLADSIRSWSERFSPPSVARAAADGEDSGAAVYRDTIRPGLAELGVLGLHVPEADGGQGAGLTELAVAVEELGRAMLPGGLVPTVLASAVLVSAGLSGKVVGSLAQGSGNGAVALTADIKAGVSARGDLVITGSADSVLGAPGADLIILPARTDAGTVWVAVDADSVDITPVASLDLTRQLGRVTATDVIVPAERQLTSLAAGAVANLAAVIYSAEAVGIAGWAVSTAADYAKLRYQFGRPIGQFQAVKHRCARMLVSAEQAAAVVWDAARALDDSAPDAGSEFAAAAAASLAADAAVSCVHECIQVLGGIGYTWEHEAHLYYRRALSLRALLGSSAKWAERVAGLALAGVRRPVQVELSGGDAELRAGIREELTAIAALAGAERTERLAADGWVVPHLPRPWGRGAGPLEQVVIAQEMRAAGVRAPGLVIGAWVVPALIQYGTPEQQQRFLPPTLRGGLVWCQLFSEPGAGSDLAGLTTRAVRADGGWKLTGQKIWTSLAKQAAWAICIARTDPAAPKHDGITYFLVDMSSPGVEVRPLREITGDSLFNQVFLDEVFVPDDCVLGEVNGGWRVARTTLANERVSLSQTWAFGSGVPELLKVAQAAADPPLGPVGRLVCEGHAIDLLGLRVTLKQLSGTDPGATGSVRKLLGMEHAQQVAELCLAMSGPEGALGGAAGAPVGRPGAPNGAYWARQVLMTQVLTIGGGTTDIQLNIIGERILGLPRDPEPPAG